jgi:hypothetical protein
MPQPTQGDVHVNTPLTNISIAYMQDAMNFVADRIFPNVPVAKQSDRYYVYDRGFFNRDEMEVRAPGTESAGSGYEVDNTPTYYAPVYAFHHDIPDQVRSNADSQVDPDRDATNLVTHKGLIKREKLWVSKFFTSSVWTTDIDGVAGSPSAGETIQWNDASSDPIADVRLGVRTVLELTGFKPNTLVLGKAVFDALIDHPDIVDRIKYGQSQGNVAMADTAELAALLKIPRVFVMEAIENTAAEGASNAHSFIGGKHALLSYAAPAPGMQVPTAGYTFSWTGYLGASANGARISRFRMDPLKSDRVEIEMAFDQKLVSADLGYFFNGIVA